MLVVVLVGAVEEAPPPTEDGVVAAAAGVLGLGDEAGVVAATEDDDFGMLLGVEAGVVEDFLLDEEGGLPAEERQPRS